MVTKRTCSCGTNAGYPEEARWAPMPARVANQNAEDPTGGGGWILWHGSRKKVVKRVSEKQLKSGEKKKQNCKWQLTKIHHSISRAHSLNLSSGGHETEN